MPQVRLKCVYEALGAGDGLRVLAEAHWPRGLSLRRAALSVWAQDLAPSPGLQWRFAHDPENQAEFARLYRRELDAKAERLRDVLAMAVNGNITLLYAARSWRAGRPLASQPRAAVILAGALRHAEWDAARRQRNFRRAGRLADLVTGSVRQG